MSLHTPDTLEIFVELAKFYKAVVGVTCIQNSVSPVMEFLHFSGSKLCVKFLAKNQHVQRKSLYFVNTINAMWQKLGRTSHIEVIKTEF